MMSRHSGGLTIQRTHRCSLKKDDLEFNQEVENEWKYFLPVKNLQRYLNMLVGIREVQKKTEILGIRDEFLRNI